MIHVIYNFRILYHYLCLKNHNPQRFSKFDTIILENKNSGSFNNNNIISAPTECYHLKPYCVVGFAIAMQ